MSTSKGTPGRPPLVLDSKQITQVIVALSKQPPRLKPSLTGASGITKQVNVRQYSIGKDPDTLDQILEKNGQRVVPCDAVGEKYLHGVAKKHFLSAPSLVNEDIIVHRLLGLYFLYPPTAGRLPDIVASAAQEVFTQRRAPVVAAGAGDGDGVNRQLVFGGGAATGGGGGGLKTTGLDDDGAGAGARGAGGGGGAVTGQRQQQREGGEEAEEDDGVESETFHDALEDEEEKEEAEESPVAAKEAEVDDSSEEESARSSDDDNDIGEDEVEDDGALSGAERVITCALGDISEHGRRIGHLQGNVNGLRDNVDGLEVAVTDTQNRERMNKAEIETIKVRLSSAGL